MYLDQTDLEKGLYPEILNVLTRSNPDNISNAISEAIAEVNSYLGVRYNMQAEWNKSGSSRNVLVVKMVRDIALYNCYNISNPVNMPESRAQKYKDTISFLKDVQAERAQLDGLTRLSDASNTSGSNYLTFGGNTKRNNSY
ncbi:MAG TPA: DUF1320 family protein [Ferruginibacter sp.]|jgi:phage gp36-like protein|nr:DUF1320 family protein [Bacteroidales bacterium]HPH85567.1 DUF1320 family protein [Ferruginibacter sp.]